MTIRVQLPAHLKTLVKTLEPVGVEVDGTVTLRTVLDALEQKYPVLRGAIREHVGLERRPLIRFFACGEDWSHESPDTPLPEAISSGKEALLIIGAIAGG